jgi:hypothetical protein
MMTYLQATFMLEYKVNFMHYSMNDLKVAHSARLPGRLVTSWRRLSACGCSPWPPGRNRGAGFQPAAVRGSDMAIGQFGDLLARQSLGGGGLDNLRRNRGAGFQL